MIKIKKITRDHKVHLLMARDILDLKSNFAVNDYDYIRAIMEGDGWKQWNDMTDEQVDSEFAEALACDQIDQQAIKFANKYFKDVMNNIVWEL